MKGQLYEITTGDEDILFSIAYGALPICGVDHIGLEDDGNTLMKASGLTFGKESSHKRIAKIINLNQTPSLFNEVFGKCRAKVERRVITDAYIIARYFGVMHGRDVAKARSMLAKETQKKMEQAQEEKKESVENREHKDIRNQHTAEKVDVSALENTENTETEEDSANIIEGNFGKGDV